MSLQAKSVVIYRMIFGIIGIRRKEKLIQDMFEQNGNPDKFDASVEVPIWWLVAYDLFCY